MTESAYTEILRQGITRLRKIASDDIIRMQFCPSTASITVRILRQRADFALAAADSVESLIKLNRSGQAREHLEKCLQQLVGIK